MKRKYFGHSSPKMRDAVACRDVYTHEFPFSKGDRVTFKSPKYGQDYEPKFLRRSIIHVGQDGVVVHLDGYEQLVLFEHIIAVSPSSRWRRFKVERR